MGIPIRALLLAVVFLFVSIISNVAWSQDIPDDFEVYIMALMLRQE